MPLIAVGVVAALGAPVLLIGALIFLALGPLARHAHDDAALNSNCRFVPDGDGESFPQTWSALDLTTSSYTPLPAASVLHLVWPGRGNGQIPLGEMCVMHRYAPQSTIPHAFLHCLAVPALEALDAAFTERFGHPLPMPTGYRPLVAQQAIGDSPLAATPGTSFHGLGLAVDMTGGVFGSPSATAPANGSIFGVEYEWMRANAGAFGFFHPTWAQPGGALPEAWHWEFAGGSGSIVCDPFLATTGGTLVWPTTGTITSLFGPRNTGIPGASTNHQGIDVAAPHGTAILAAASGRVILTGFHPSCGYWIHLEHSPNERTVYCHLHSGGIDVAVGQLVAQGERIGGVGTTGVSSGNHLHFEVRIDGRSVNPAPGVYAGTPVTAGTAIGGLGLGGTIGEGGTPESNRTLARSLMRQAPWGWSGEDQWDCLKRLWQRESSWSHTARNPAPCTRGDSINTAHGIPQACTAVHPATRSAEWKASPRLQIEWGLTYIAGRYATPCAAWAFFQRNNWY